METRHEHRHAAANDPVRSAGRDPRRQRRDRGLRHRGFGVHGCARHLPRGGHPFHSRRARAGRGTHGRRLRPRVRPPRRLHCAERPRRHEFRHGHRGGLLGSLAGRVHHAGDWLDDDGARRLPGDRAAADLLEDHEIPGPRLEPEAHGRDRRALLRPCDARDGAVPAQYPAGSFLRRHPGHDQPAHAHRPRAGRRRGSRRSSHTARRREDSRSSSPAAA